MKDRYLRSFLLVVMVIILFYQCYWLFYSIRDFRSISYLGVLNYIIFLLSLVIEISAVLFCFVTKSKNLILRSIILDVILVFEASLYVYYKAKGVSENTILSFFRIGYLAMLFIGKYEILFYAVQRRPGFDNGVFLIREKTSPLK